MRLRLTPENYSCHHFVINGRHHLETEMKSEKTDYSYAAQLVQSTLILNLMTSDRIVCT